MEQEFIPPEVIVIRPAKNPVIWLRGIPSSDLVDILRHRVNEARQNSKIVELN
jgi:hypothetical protein